MKIINEIKRIVEDELNVPFMYQSFLNLNNWLDSAPLPCVACQLLIGGELISEAGQTKESSEVLLMFIDKTEVYGYTALENQAIIDTQKLRAVWFMEQVRQSSVIYALGNARYDNIYNEFDIITTGVAVRVTLKELVGVVECFNKVFDNSFSQNFG